LIIAARPLAMSATLASSLPAPDPAAAEHSRAVAACLRDAVRQAGGWLSFETWMHLALYAPGLGYYAAGSTKLAERFTQGPANAAPRGDFVTAPELTPLFGQTLAGQVAHVLRDTGTANVLEFGAGSGALADALIVELNAVGLSVSYDIVEVSADLRERQRQRLARHGTSVRWLDALPDAFSGCVIANEVLDAMPVRLFRWDDAGQLMERGVTWLGDVFAWAERPADRTLASSVAARMPPLPGYASEINRQAEIWVGDMGRWLTRGAALLIDYGFPQREYYHPQRSDGTLMSHFRHHAHGDPLVLPGLQDITAHVDFTAMADAAWAGGLDIMGYTSQARFLIEAGLLQRLAELDLNDPRIHTSTLGPVQKLLSEAEMGELFKVLALGKGLKTPLPAFLRGDRRRAL